MAETVEVTAQCDCDDEATVTIELPEPTVTEAPVAQATVDGFAQFAEQFGLTPAARSRLIAGNENSSGHVDEMDELLGGG